MTRRLYLGVDGGQSSTTALIADGEGRILGEGRDGPCNHVSSGEAIRKFTRVIGGCVAKAAEAAKLDANAVSFAAACLGLSGGPADKEPLVHTLIRSDKYKVTHDAEIALAGALSGRPGIVVISGTGSMAFGRDASGRTARAGGWGYVFGDEGGAFDLVRRALRAALSAEEGWGRETALQSALLSGTGVSTVSEAMHLFYTPEWPRSRVAALASIVTEAAEAGDAVANQVMQQAAAALARYAEGVYRALFRNEVAAVSFAGGTFASKPLLSAFNAAIRERLNRELTRPEKTAAEGAVLEALRLS